MEYGDGVFVYGADDGFDLTGILKEKNFQRVYFHVSSETRLKCWWHLTLFDQCLCC